MAATPGKKKLAKPVAATGLTVEQMLRDYRRLAMLVTTRQLAQRVSRDPDDDSLLACALAARADLIVSGDDDLIVLKRYQDIPIATPTLTVHRGTQQIGGSCIELTTTAGERLILDAGRPLDAPEGTTGLLPKTLDRTGFANVLISHPHQDHWGLLDELPTHCPVWKDAASAKLIAVTGEIMRRTRAPSFRTWTSRSGRLAIGAFSVTPFLIDHSAFDAYMLLIEADGKRVLYTGDFRRHGRKSVLDDRLTASPPAGIDVLLALVYSSISAVGGAGDRQTTR